MNWRSALVRAVIRATGMTDQQLVQSLWGNVSQPPRKGSKELLEAYNTMPWLRSIMGRVSWSIGAVPWCLYVETSKKDGGKARRNRAVARNMKPEYRMARYKDMRADDSLKEITNHPALDLLDHGNAKFPGQICFQLSQTHLDLVGESLWVLDRAGIPMGNSPKKGMPTDIWPVPPTWVTAWPSQERPEFMIASPRGSLIVPESDVIWFRHPSPDDPYVRSTGLGFAMADELETDEYAAKHLKAWFRNYARPEVIITADGLVKTEVDRLEDQWLKKLAQQNNKPHFINRKIDVKEISHTFQEMQLTELRKAERDILIHTIGMPPEILGIIENSNRSTIDAADYLYAKYVQVPRLEFLRIMLQIHLIEKYDERLILDYVSPVMEDKEFELKVRQAQPSAFDVDEWRELGGAAPLDGKKGKIYLVSINTSAVENLDELVDDEVEPAPGIAVDDDGDGPAAPIPPTPAPPVPVPSPAPADEGEE